MFHIFLFVQIHVLKKKPQKTSVFACWIFLRQSEVVSIAGMLEQVCNINVTNYPCSHLQLKFKWNDYCYFI